MDSPHDFDFDVEGVGAVPASEEGDVPGTHPGCGVDAASMPCAA